MIGSVLKTNDNRTNFTGRLKSFTLLLQFILIIFMIRFSFTRLYVR